VEPVERAVAERYGASKNKVLGVFKAVAKNKRGINESELARCLTDLRLSESVEDKVVKAIFEGNIATNGTF
jgi:hypothetical protein